MNLLLLREQGRDKYRNLSEEEQKKKDDMEKIDISICLKKRKKEYQKNYNEAKKSQYSNE